MIDFTALETALYTWASTVLPTTPIIFYNPNAPRPSVDYVTLHLMTFRSIGWDFKGATDSLGVRAQRGDREIALSVQSYGASAFSLLYELKNSLQKEQIIDLLDASGISFADAGDISDITALINSRYEERAAVDLFFRVADAYTDEVGLIETVEIDETIDTINDVQIIELT